MIELRNHYEGKTTYIVGRYIINGCRMFDVEELDAIALEYNVDKDMVEEVRNLALNNQEDWDNLELINYKVKITCARQGRHLATLIDDKNWYVREAVARQGYGLDILTNDKDWHVRVAVVECRARL